MLVVSQTLRSLGLSFCQVGGGECAPTGSVPEPDLQDVHNESLQHHTEQFGLQQLAPPQHELALRRHAKENVAEDMLGCHVLYQ